MRKSSQKRYLNEDLKILHQEKAAGIFFRQLFFYTPFEVKSSRSRKTAGSAESSK